MKNKKNFKKKRQRNHSGTTVEAQWKHSGNTVEAQWKHSGTTVVWYEMCWNITSESEWDSTVKMWRGMCGGMKKWKESGRWKMILCRRERKSYSLVSLDGHSEQFDRPRAEVTGSRVREVPGDGIEDWSQQDAVLKHWRFINTKKHESGGGGRRKSFEASAIFLTVFVDRTFFACRNRQSIVTNFPLEKI